MLALCAAAGCAEVPNPGGVTYTGQGGSTGTAVPTPTLAPFTTHLTVTQDPNNPAVTQGVTLSPLLNPSRCIDVPSGESTDGVVVQLWDCNGYAPAQLWSWNDGTLRIQGGTKCLVVGGSDVLQATTVVIDDCIRVSTTPQQGVWNYINGLVQAGSANRCLQVGDSSAQRGIALTLAACSSSDARQRWGIDNHDANFLRGGMVSISTNTAKCLDVQASDGDGGTRAEIYDCDAGEPQQWVMEGLAIRALGKCLAVASSDSTAVELASCDSSAAQQWVLNAGQIQRGDGSTCLELPNGDTSNLNPVRVVPCTGASQQQWVWGGTN